MQGNARSGFYPGTSRLVVPSFWVGKSMIAELAFALAFFAEPEPAALERRTWVVEHLAAAYVYERYFDTSKPTTHMVPEGTVVELDLATNSLLAVGPAEALAQMDQLMDLLDIPPKVVRLKIALILPSIDRTVRLDVDAVGGQTLVLEDPSTATRVEFKVTLTGSGSTTLDLSATAMGSTFYGVVRAEPGQPRALYARVNSNNGINAARFAENDFEAAVEGALKVGDGSEIPPTAVLVIMPESEPEP